MEAAAKVEKYQGSFSRLNLALLKKSTPEIKCDLGLSGVGLSRLSLLLLLLDSTRQGSYAAG